MEKKKGFLPREGLYIDPIARLIRRTALNPALTLPVLVFLRLSPRFWPHVQWTDSLRVTGLLYILQRLAIVGSLLSLNDYLTRQFNNNWTTDSTYDWDKEIVVITGGSSGIGASLVRQLLDRNPRSRLVIIDYSPLSYDVPENARLTYYQCDLSIASAIRDVCEQIRSEIGHPTVLVNNAGLARGATVADGSYADVEVTFRTNAIAPFLLIKEFLPEMIRRNHGHVITISSFSSVLPPPNVADYAATKSAVVALHEVTCPLSAPSSLDGELIRLFRAIESRTGTEIPSSCPSSPTFSRHP